MNEKYSSELLEDLEAIEIKGGFGVYVTHPGQCGCINTAKGCGLLDLINRAYEGFK